MRGTQTRSRHLRVVPQPYRLPDPLDTLEDALRLYQLDVDSLTPSQRWAEAQQVRRVLAYLIATGERWIVLPPYTRIPATSWCRERLERLGERVA